MARPQIVVEFGVVQKVVVRQSSEDVWRHFLPSAGRTYPIGGIFEQ